MAQSPLLFSNLSVLAKFASRTMMYVGKYTFSIHNFRRVAFGIGASIYKYRPTIPLRLLRFSRNFDLQCTVGQRPTIAHIVFAQYSVYGLTYAQSIASK